MSSLSLSTIELNGQAIICHDVNGLTVGQQKSNGYINATRLTQAHKQITGQRRDVANWLSNKRVQETLHHLSSNTGIPVNQLYQVFQGSPENGGGTWLHPKLATRFAMWLSDDFGLMVEEWVQGWSSQPSKTPLTLPQSYKEALKALIEEVEAKERLEVENALLEEENHQLSEALDELFDYSSIVRVAKFNKIHESNFSWRPLKAMSIKMGIEIKQVPDARYMTKNIYSHDVWRVVYPWVKLPETTTLVIKNNFVHAVDTIPDYAQILDLVMPLSTRNFFLAQSKLISVTKDVATIEISSSNLFRMASTSQKKSALEKAFCDYYGKPIVISLKVKNQ